MTLYAAVAQRGGDLTMSDVVIVGRADEDDELRSGVEAIGDQATATIDRIAFERTGGFAMAAADRATLRAHDVVVRDTRSTEASTLRGIGAGTQNGATLELARALLERTVQAAIGSDVDGGSLSVADVAIYDTLSTPFQPRARAIVLSEQTHATFDRVRIRGGVAPAVLLARDDASATMRDLDIADVGPGPTTGVGTIHAQLRSILRGERIRVRRGTSSGLVFFDGARGSIEDVIVEDTRGDPDGKLGRGISTENAALFARRVRVSGSREVGVSVYGPRAVVRLEEVEVERTLERECAVGACADTPAGFGVGVAQGALTLDHFRVAGSALCGAFVADAGMLDLSHGEVRDNPVGVCMQIDGYELDRLRDDVSYVDNGTPLSATMLPVPMAISRVE